LEISHDSFRFRVKVASRQPAPPRLLAAEATLYNNAGVSTLYNAPANPTPGQAPFSINPLVVSIPTPGDPFGATGTPTGTVFNTDGNGTVGFKRFKLSGIAVTKRPGRWRPRGCPWSRPVVAAPAKTHSPQGRVADPHRDGIAGVPPTPVNLS